MLQDLWTFASPAIVEVSLQHLVLEPAALNALHGLDVTVVGGKVGKLKMSIPWRNLLHERTKIYLENVRRLPRGCRG